jgi:excisionase family DNA binding protein
MSMTKTTAEGTGVDIAGRATLSVPEAGVFLGIGRSAAYEAVRRGEIPHLRIGRRVLVPVPRLLALLGHKAS